MEPKLDIFKLMRENFKAAPDVPDVQFLGVYLLLRSDEDDFLLAPEQDIDRCTFVNTNVDSFIFKDPNDNLIPCKKSDYRKKWVAVNTLTIQGTMLNAAYDELTYQIRNQLPPNLKDKVKF